MIIFQKYKVGFIHIPKNGGSALRESFKSYIDTKNITNNPNTIHVDHQHSTYLQSKLDIPFLTQDFSIIAVVRDPLTRFISTFLNFESLFGGYNSFEDFLIDKDNFFKKNFHHYSFQPQINYLKGVPKDKLYIIRYESLQEESKKIFSNLGINLTPLQKINYTEYKFQNKPIDKIKNKMYNSPNLQSFVKNYYIEDYKSYYSSKL